MARNRKRPGYNPKQKGLAPRRGPAPYEHPRRGDPRILDQPDPFSILESNVEEPNFDELAQAMLVRLRGALKMSLPMIRSLYLWQIHHNTNLSAATADSDRRLFTAIVDIVERLLVENSTANKEFTT